jgi:hypothetical protein
MSKIAPTTDNVVETGELVVKETAKLLTPKRLLVAGVIVTGLVVAGVIVKKRKAATTETTEASENAAE